MKNSSIGIPIPTKPQKEHPGFFDGFPIEFYHGILFKSKIEVEWAKYSDSLKIKWEYEPEYFDIGHGRRYTPDFKINNMYFEVKTSIDQVIDGSYRGQDKFERFIECGYKLIFLVGYGDDKKIFDSIFNERHRLILKEISIVDIIEGGIRWKGLGLKEPPKSTLDKVKSRIGQSRITGGDQ